MPEGLLDLLLGGTGLDSERPVLLRQAARVIRSCRRRSGADDTACAPTARLPPLSTLGETLTAACRRGRSDRSHRHSHFLQLLSLSPPQDPTLDHHRLPGGRNENQAKKDRNPKSSQSQRRSRRRLAVAESGLMSHFPRPGPHPIYRANGRAAGAAKQPYPTFLRVKSGGEGLAWELTWPRRRADVLILFPGPLKGPGLVRIFFPLILPRQATGPEIAIRVLWAGPTILTVLSDPKGNGPLAFFSKWIILILPGQK